MSYSTLNSAASRFLLYGNGEDGDVTTSIDVSLTRDMYYNNLTINSGAIIYTNNYRVFVKNTLTLNNGGFRCITGIDGSGVTAGARPPNNFYGRGTAATNGVAGSANGGASISVSPGIGTQGGQGGGDGVSRVGGTVGTVTVEPTLSGGVQFIRSVVGLITGRSLKVISSGGYGSGTQVLGTGGTGGGAGTASTSGGGGGTGGWVVVIARLIVDGGSGGTIYARGGNGGNAVSGNAGGGGGGPGGICGIVTDSNPIPAGILYDANGGAGGTGLGTGTAGSTGNAGHVVVFYN